MEVEYSLSAASACLEECAPYTTTPFESIPRGRSGGSSFEEQIVDAKYVALQEEGAMKR